MVKHQESTWVKRVWKENCRVMTYRTVDINPLTEYPDIGFAKGYALRSVVVFIHMNAVPDSNTLVALTTILMQ